MHLFFEDGGELKAGTVLESSGGAEPTSHQVELPTGRRVKIKAKDVLFPFPQPAPELLLRDAQALAEEIDVAFLWEVAPQDDFEIGALGKEYYGDVTTPVQAAALLMRVHAAPMYFRRRGKGVYRPAPKPELEAALAGLERKRLAAEQQAQLVAQLLRGEAPAGWADTPPGVPPGWLPKAAWLLHKPDKNGIEWKALEQAAREAQTTPAKLLLRVGAFADAWTLHRSGFLVEWFPKGPEAAAPPPRAADARLPLAQVEAFSIDDSQTTEIDDAFSVQRLDAGRVRVGVHIAAPGLAMQPGDAVDAIARKRLSTVYMPGEKITMLPDAVVAAYTLAQGAPRPAVSLYAEFVLETGECLGTDTRLERVPVVANLRHDALDADVTEASLADPSIELPFGDALRALWTLAQHLSRARETVRGKPEPRNRTDFQFRIVAGDDGARRVSIEPRRRDAPLDRLVAEWMIFVNNAWGRRLAEAGVPGIYRTQTQWGRPGAKQSAVRMSTAPAPHLGLGVTHYAWSSSPLRRYVDLVNQWQLLALLRLQRPPFAKGDADLFAVIGAFDTAYAAYAEVQSRMERYWCLRWLVQEDGVGNGRRHTASVMRNEQVRFASIPLVATLAGIGHLAPGTPVDVEVLAVDEIELAVQLRLAEVHVRAEAAIVEGDAVDETEDAGDEEEAAVAQTEAGASLADAIPRVDPAPRPADAKSDASGPGSGL